MRFTAWIEQLAERPYVGWLLVGTGVIEGSVFPLPPDLLLIPLAVNIPRKAFSYSTLCIIGSVAGAMIGYVIGAGLYDALGASIIGITGFGSHFTALLDEYHRHALLTLLLAGFTNIPFCVFTIAAGFRGTLDPSTLFLGALFGRAVRFYLLAALLYVFGPVARRFLQKYLAVISLAVVLLFVTTVFLLRLAGR